ncbi:hypothetical protein QA597_09540 [Marinilabiliaceae bacterium ANBcel2]|nr:hypothetical protein [Marinilabiliaceae bacterium ANBcel2]
MNKFSVIYPLILFFFVFSACSDDDDDYGIEDIEKYSFADESANEGKQALENSGKDLMNHMDQMANSSAMEAMEVMIYYIETGKHFDEEFEKLFRNLDIYANNTENSTALPNLKGASYENESISEIFDDNVGVYHWDSETNDWVFDSGSDKIELHFPSVTDLATENDLIATFDFSGKQAIEGIELPELIEFTLEQHNTSLISHKMTASYDSDGLPNEMSLNTSIDDDYIISANAEYNKDDINASYSVKENSLTLIEFIVSSKGDFDIETLEESVDGPVEFVENANISLQLADVIFIGQANVNYIYEAEQRIYENRHSEDFDFEQAANEFVTIANENAKFIIAYADSNTKFAESEFYVVESDFDDHHYYDLQLIFADDSRGDFEAYFQESFQDILEELNAILDELGIRL